MLLAIMLFFTPSEQVQIGAVDNNDFHLFRISANLANQSKLLFLADEQFSIEAGIYSSTG
jgi:hypothetical protein